MKTNVIVLADNSKELNIQMENSRLEPRKQNMEDHKTIEKILMYIAA